jgi:hypothetical protein
MLKIWKSTWKGTDDRDLRPKRDSEQDDMVGEHGGASPLIVGAATPPLDAILPSALPDGAKCTRKHIEIEDILNDEPRKKLRPNGSPVSGSLGLGNHLPEINDTDKVESLFPLSISVFREQVLEHAKRENSELYFSSYSFLLIFLFSDRCPTSVKKCKLEPLHC